MATNGYGGIVDDSPKADGVSQSALIRRYTPEPECKSCKHRTWAEGDIEFSPPGWGVYYCKPLDEVLTEDQAKHKGRLDGCPLVGA